LTKLTDETRLVADDSVGVLAAEGLPAVFEQAENKTKVASEMIKNRFR
jgi:hypothetical protein